MKVTKRLIYAISVLILLIPTCLCGFVLASFLIPQRYDRIGSQVINETRQPLPDDAIASQIFPPQIGEYLLNGSRATSGSMYFQHYFHREYMSADRAKIRLEAGFVKEGYSKERVFWSSTVCGNTKGIPKLFLDERIPFGYAFCEGPLLTQYRITWMSGKWLLRASSGALLRSDDDMLIEFVGQYNY